MIRSRNELTEQKASIVYYLHSFRIHDEYKCRQTVNIRLCEDYDTNTANYAIKSLFKYILLNRKENNVHIGIFMENEN